MKKAGDATYADGWSNSDTVHAPPGASEITSYYLDGMNYVLNWNDPTFRGTGSNLTFNIYCRHPGAGQSWSERVSDIAEDANSTSNRYDISIVSHPECNSNVAVEAVNEFAGEWATTTR